MVEWKHDDVFHRRFHFLKLLLLPELRPKGTAWPIRR